ncbi:hypothetical protein G1L03_01290 [Tenacibaculum finnmarkense]|uniref:hypothetical protein n=1 Tax=Tenacibaculum finnmarkense TaxID=2781243 RepID=UPI001EFBADDE|nr:hypothetical protein [Tenacibaculum finnmarkense]MCG8247941.1 hypothetical protein [Tenacibaculum finnmarkense genomovar finnmarkense]MCG8791954.1 hypothetical protein [Tenacibaculum finnmarkense]MCG8868468.1 hypothetical protein [Tenacibaculum finnmarkense]
MNKKSKITVKHYLNKRLKAYAFPDISNIIEYRVYISITYNRMNLRIPSEVVYAISEEDFQGNNIAFKLEYEKDLIKRSVEIYQKDEELKKLKKDFYLLYPLKKYRSKNERLNILSSYIDFYKHSIYNVVSDFLYNEIKTKVLNEVKIIDLQIIGKHQIDYIFSPDNPNLYELIRSNKLGYKYEVYSVLWAIFHNYLAEQGRVYGYDMPFIDWEQKRGQILFKKYLKNYTCKSTDKWNLEFLNNENINYMIEIIEKIIFNDYLKKRNELK